VKVFI